MRVSPPAEYPRLGLIPGIALQMKICAGESSLLTKAITSLLSICDYSHGQEYSINFVLKVGDWDVDLMQSLGP